jgi:hypothetical protein
MPAPQITTSAVVDVMGARYHGCAGI